MAFDAVDEVLYYFLADFIAEGRVVLENRTDRLGFPYLETGD